jgi:hypothetical protein
MKRNYFYFLIGCFLYANGLYAQQPSAPQNVTANPSVICNGSSTNLSATTSAPNEIKWYTQAAGGISIGTSANGANFAVNPTVNTTYYAEAVTPSGSQTFAYTGAVQSWTVPANVSQIQIDATGASGMGLTAAGAGGKGARVQATLNVTPNTVIYVYVGGQGGDNSGGFNGGANTGRRKGGGATDLRIGGQTASNRVFVAGGGGAASTYAMGGDGGNSGTAGANGLHASVGINGGGGASVSAGGTSGAGTANGTAGTNAGVGGNGGNGASTNTAMIGGNGGGGYFGGGGGGANSINANQSAGGGGGSSFVSPTYLNGTATYTTGHNTGNGSVIISWVGVPSASRVSVEVNMMLSPSSISTSNITASSVDLTWTNTGAAAYQWEIVNAGAGANASAIASGTTTSPTISATASGLLGGTNYDVYVRSQCSDNNTSDWSAVTSFQTIPACTTPSLFTVTGGGTYCSGGSAIPIWLSGSQVSAFYYLYLDGTPTNDSLAGTGNALSFGTFTTEGTYSIFAKDIATGLCTTFMNDSMIIVLASPVTLSANIAITAGSQTIAEGSTVTFTATATNGGTSPTYNWKVDGMAVGVNTATYTTDSLLDGQVVTCEVTSSLVCFMPAIAQSNDITMTVTSIRWYVNANATGDNSGTSWVNAFTSLQTALEVATPALDIWVAAGTYKPSKDPFGSTSPSDLRNRTFYPKDSVKVYGGFAGNETSLAQRDWESNPTILSGDFDNNDTYTGTGATFTATNTGENAYHLLTFVNHDVESILDGFYIVRGSANDVANGSVTIAGQVVENNYGGGIACVNAAPSLSNLIFLNNTAKGGGAIANQSNASPTIISCNFIANHATIEGGAIFNQNNSFPAVDYCIFTGNSTTNSGKGGAIMNGENTITLCWSSVFENNYAGQGGAIYEYRSTNSLENCVLVGNTANTNGGAVMNDSSFVTYLNCTFYNNSATVEGATFYNKKATFECTNTIVWGGTSAGEIIFYNAPVVSNVNYSIIEGATIPTGIANSNSNPLFISTTNPLGADNKWLTEDDGLRLACGSSAYDAGTDTVATTLDILGNTMYGASKDIGAYEKQEDNAFTTVSVTQNGGATSGSGITTLTTACLGTPITLTATATGPALATYQWQRNGIDLTGATNASLVLTSGWGVYRVRVTNVNACLTNTDTFAVSFKGLPNAQAGSDKIICVGSSVTIGSNTLAGATYSWHPTTGLSNPTISNPVATVSSQSQTYTVFVTGANGCTKSDALNINSLTLPSAPVLTTTAPSSVLNNPTPTICEGSIIAITPSNVVNATHLQWIRNNMVLTTTSNLTGNLLINSTAGGTNIYTAKVKGLNGCFSPASNAISATVNVAPQPTITPSGTNNLILVCFNGATSASQILTANTTVGTPSYSWYQPGFTGFVGTLDTYTAVISNTATSKTYNVRATYANGCVRTSVNKVVRKNTACREENEALVEVFQAHPNPVTDKLSVMLDNYKEDKVLLSLTNVLGQIIYTYPLEITEGRVETTLDLSALSTGIYYLTLDTQMKHEIIKVMKE